MKSPCLIFPDLAIKIPLVLPLWVVERRLVTCLAIDGRCEPMLPSCFFFFVVAVCPVANSGAISRRPRSDHVSFGSRSNDLLLNAIDDRREWRYSCNSSHVRPSYQFLKKLRKTVCTLSLLFFSTIANSLCFYKKCKCFQIQFLPVLSLGSCKVLYVSACKYARGT